MVPQNIRSDEVTLDRRRSKDRRTGPRRVHHTSITTEHRGGRERRKVQRRRQIDPTTCERDYTSEEIEFMTAMDRYKRQSGRQFPTCSEILEVLRALGYRRDTAPAEKQNHQPQPEVDG